MFFFSNMENDTVMVSVFEQMQENKFQLDGTAF